LVIAVAGVARYGFSIHRVVGELFSHTALITYFLELGVSVLMVDLRAAAARYIPLREAVN
jgi:hypothetical protein